MQPLLCVALLLGLSAITAHAKASRPHIVFVLADDYGWNDIGYHQTLGVTTNNLVHTPHLDSLAAQGVKLEQYYTQPLCSPTRAALMTGRYAFHTGIGPYVIPLQKGYGLPPKERVIAEELKTVGYKTRIVGKWHLGYCDTRYYPTNRGFDTWFGFSSGMQNYWTHFSDDYSVISGYDFRRATAGNLEAQLVLPESTYNGTYGLFTHVDEAVRIIKDHGAHHKNEPLFLYLPLQSVHDPLQVPDQYLTQYSGITDTNRKIYAAMVTAMDEGIANVTAALKKSGLWDNTVFIFASDNGGPWQAAANNYPLRGQKFQNWEGGIRASAFVAGGGAKLHSNVKGKSLRNLMHVTDWYPTIRELARVTSEYKNPIDGVSQWHAISTGAVSPRSRIVINMSPVGGTLHGALREGKWKLIFQSAVSGSLAQVNTVQQYPNGWSEATGATALPAPYNGTWLFDIVNDPTESVNLAETHPAKLKELKDLFFQLQADDDVVDDLSNHYIKDPISVPSLNSLNAWLPWNEKVGTTCTAWADYDAEMLSSSSADDSDD